MSVHCSMGQLGHPATVAEVRRRFAAHASGAEKIPADLRAPVYNAVMANGDRATFDQMVALYRAEELHEEQGGGCSVLSRIFSALIHHGCLRPGLR